MKKLTRRQLTESSVAETARTGSGAWRWWVAAVALFLVLDVYGPALDGPFVWDDRFQPFYESAEQARPLSAWLAGNRPLLMFTFWANFRVGKLDPAGYHTVNVLLHFANAVLLALILARLLEWAGVSGPRRAILTVAGSALFLLHPLQTESVSYVTSRSETLSVGLYFAAFTLFLHRPPGPIRPGRVLALGALAALALTTKEHTLTLPLLLLLTDLFWNPKPRENLLLYVLMGIAGVAGAAYVFSILDASQSAGFELAGRSPAAYFFTQCRVIWNYLRLFVLPLGQNLDPDIPLSQTPLDHGAVFGLIGLVGVAAAAWLFRKRWPLASFGIFVFLLLLAPTSSVVPINDVMAERRMYLPFLGLVLVALEGLRRVPVRETVIAGVVALAAFGVLTYRRNLLWGSPVALWQDTTDGSPRKVRPRSQLAMVYYEMGDCDQSARHFSDAIQLQPPSQALVINLGLSLFCLGLDDEALKAYNRAQSMNPEYDLTYVYRGDVYAHQGDITRAVQDYERALTLNPDNLEARQSLARLKR